MHSFSTPRANGLMIFRYAVNAWNWVLISASWSFPKDNLTSLFKFDMYMKVFVVVVQLQVSVFSVIYTNKVKLKAASFPDQQNQIVNANLS